MIDNNDIVNNKIAILGGTGKEGKGLGYRWANAGYEIIIGSRLQEKAQNSADELRSICKKGAKILGMTNEKAAIVADIAVLTVPYSAHQSMLETLKPFLKGKILIDVTVPLVPPKVSKVQMPSAGSAALETKQVVGDDTIVVAAFQNISYENLLANKSLDCDVLVCGEGKTSREKVLGLVKAAGMIGWDAGPLENAVVVEGMTSILIGINKQYGVQSAGIQITGVPRPII